MTMSRYRPLVQATCRQRGFTLMEVLIAVSITAVIGLGVWQMMSSVITSSDRVDVVADEFEGLQKTFLLLERDLRQIVNRPVRNIYGDQESAITSQGEEFEFLVTRQGWRNPLANDPTATPRSELQRSAWEFTGEEIRRRYWVMLDQAQEEESRDQLLLSNVTAFNVRFMDESRSWQDSWPPPNQGVPTGGGAADIPLPMAVEVTLEHERFGELSRLFLMPDFDSVQAQVGQTQANQQGEEDEVSEDDAENGPVGGGT